MLNIYVCVADVENKLIEEENAPPYESPTTRIQV